MEKKHYFYIGILFQSSYYFESDNLIYRLKQPNYHWNYSAIMTDIYLLSF